MSQEHCMVLYCILLMCQVLSLGRGKCKGVWELSLPLEKLQSRRGVGNRDKAAWKNHGSRRWEAGRMARKVVGLA